jgi:hypothetical protein
MSRVPRYIRMGLIVTFPHLDISTPTFDSYLATLVSPVNHSLLSAFAQIIVFSCLLADHPFAVLITVKSSCHLVIPWFIGRRDILCHLDQLKQPLASKSDKR